MGDGPSVAGERPVVGRCPRVSRDTDAGVGSLHKWLVNTPHFMARAYRQKLDQLLLRSVVACLQITGDGRARRYLSARSPSEQ